MGEDQNSTQYSLACHAASFEKLQENTIGPKSSTLNETASRPRSSVSSCVLSWVFTAMNLKEDDGSSSSSSSEGKTNSGHRKHQNKLAKMPTTVTSIMKQRQRLDNT